MSIFKSPMNLNKKSWKTSLLGVLMACLGVFEIGQHKDILDAIQDPHIQIVMFTAAIGFLAKDKDVVGDNSGVPSPKDKEE